VQLSREMLLNIHQNVVLKPVLKAIIEIRQKKLMLVVISVKEALHM
jgi:DNA-directed RNA polymerase subunit K/omega